MLSPRPLQPQNPSPTQYLGQQSLTPPQLQPQAGQGSNPPQLSNSNHPPVTSFNNQIPVSSFNNPPLRATKVSSPQSQPTSPLHSHLLQNPPHLHPSQQNTRSSRTPWRVSGPSVSKAQLLATLKFAASWRMSA